MARLVALLASALSLAAVDPAGAAMPGGRTAVRRALEAASVQIEPSRCSGVLAEEPDVVVTALHCIDDPVDSVQVRFADGWVREAHVAATDQSSDQAVLVLDEPVAIEPLPVVRRRQIPGTVLYFLGHPAQPRFQEARLDRIGRCDSLPRLPNALFTSIAGSPGDSGAPLVDALARIVGLVHGGAQCHIATPADSLVRLLDQVIERPDVHLTSRPPTPGRGGA
jgi:S1-C subfamily serine protease